MQAIKLMKKDVSMLGRGKSDPYIIVTMGAQEFRSKTIDNTVNPKWDFWCEVNNSISLAIFFFFFLFCAYPCEFKLIFFH